MTPPLDTPGGIPEPDAEGPPGDHARDGHFDGFRVAASGAAREIVREAVQRVEAYEAHARTRKRARRAADAVTFHATVEAVVCDLIHHHLTLSPGALAIPLAKSIIGNRSRYRPPALNRMLPGLLRTMAAPKLGLAVVIKGHPARWSDEDGGLVDGRRTTIEAGPLLRRWIDDRQLTFADLGRAASQEVMVLRGKKARGRGGKRSAPLIEYTDDAWTKRARREVAQLNEWLAAADVTLAPGYGGPLIDTSAAARCVVRIFNDGSFKRGGRLARGFWLSLDKSIRRSHLRIGGEPVVEVDYKGMFVALAFILVGQRPPERDPYSVPPWGAAYREGVKKLVNALLNDTTRRRRLPSDIDPATLPAVRYGELRAAIDSHLPEIALLFGSAVGLELMKTESEITMRAALLLRRAGSFALPLHDGWLAAGSEADAVADAMRQAAVDVLGEPLKVVVKTPTPPHHHDQP